MKRRLSSLATVAGAALLAACSGSPEPDPRIAIGRVQAIYVERAPGVYVDHRVSPDGSAARRWAAVVLREPLAEGRSFTTALIDGGILPEVGDTVELHVGAHTGQGESSAHVSAIVSRRAERAAGLNIKGPRWAS
ncbi:MAG: hypothetical protein IT532_06605 [Burkholderiales bacterium]|nr:hypothetical protein [Burkholderiales bacterium]